jgi:hypothetical protein
MLRKALWFSGVLALGFVAGVGAALLYVDRSFDAGKWFGAVGESFLMGQYAHTQYREADYSSAAAALQAYISYLEHLAPYDDPWAPGQSPWLGQEGLLLDCTLAWSRLAVLHERNGNPEAAGAAWYQARNYASKCHWRDTSEEHLRSVIARFERELPPSAPNP